MGIPEIVIRCIVESNKPLTPIVIDGELYCAACRQCVGDIGEFDYCPKCGNPVDWDID